jgi:hypothetical protein
MTIILRYNLRRRVHLRCYNWRYDVRKKRYNLRCCNLRCDIRDNLRYNKRNRRCNLGRRMRSKLGCEDVMEGVLLARWSTILLDAGGIGWSLLVPLIHCNVRCFLFVAFG